MKKNKKSSVLRKVKHQIQNENRSSFSERFNLSGLFAKLVERLKSKPLEVVIFFYRFYNLIHKIIELIISLNLF